jgi:hypothetical protein
MITVQEWQHRTIIDQQEHARRDREAIGSGIAHMRRAAWAVPLPPTTPVHDADELVVAPGASAFYVNIPALAVAVALVGVVNWVRVEPAGSLSEQGTVRELYTTAARHSRGGGANDFLILGVHVERGALTRWFLRPSDTLGQDQDPPFAPAGWSRWDAAPTGIFVAGLPRLDPQSAVRRVVAAWIRSGRIDRLPWETAGVAVRAC